MSRFRFLLVVVALATTTVFSQAQAALSCGALDKIEQLYFTQHISVSGPTAVVEQRTIEQYIKRIDSSKLYLLQSDVDEIKKLMRGFLGKVKDGNCGFIETVQKLYVKRVQDRVDFVKSTISAKNFKFEPKTELVLDPDSRKYAKTEKELNAFHLKYIQFQISNYMATGTKFEEAKEQLLRNYQRVFKRINETSRDDQYAAYLDSFSRALDPHSSFFSKDDLDDFKIQMGLSLEGIGANLSSQDGFTVVEQLIEGGSAKASGQIQSQDKILSVGQFKADGEPDVMESVVDMDLRDVVKKIRGPKGSKVRLLVLRQKTDGTKERITVTLNREKIKLEDEAAAISFVDQQIGTETKKIAVLNLPAFYSDNERGGRSAATDMKNLLKQAKDKGASALVLDLSQNGGGSLDDAVRIAGLFFKTGAVVKQNSRDPSAPESLLRDIDPTVDWEGPLVVLTSRISASASEIVSGTLRDYKRAVIVGGDHTFGKGSVQSVVPLPVGLGAVKVTVGMYFTPGGFSTQNRGVPGDVTLPGVFSTPEIGEKSLDYALPEKKLASFVSEDAYVSEGPDAWKKIEPGLVEQLKVRSQIRVAKNADFNKIIKEAREVKKGKVIKLSEALKDGKEKKTEADSKKNLSKDEKIAEYLKRADIMEAVAVAADLAALQRGVALAKLEKGDKSPEELKKEKHGEVDKITGKDVSKQ